MSPIRTCALALVLTACGGEAPRSAPPRVPAPPAAATAVTPAAPATVKRLVVSMGRVAGKTVTTTMPDGTISYLIDVVENGRGPHVEATLRLAIDGTPARFEAKGHHTMGTPVDEKLSI